MTDPTVPEEAPPDSSESLEENSEAASPLAVHFRELRNRLIYSIVYLAAGCIVGFFVSGSYLIPWILSPILRIPDASLQVLGPAELLTTYFKTSFIAGLLIAAPFIVHQVWLFLRPGLKRHERRFLLIFIPTSVVLFLVGGTFVFYVMVPAGLPVLLGIDFGVPIEENITLDRYFSFVLMLILAGGLVFQIPVVTYFLAKVGLVSPRAMAERRKIAIVGTVLLAAMLTPTGDPFNLMLLALPIYILYEVSIFIAGAAYRKPGESTQ